jgi:Zn-dependent protease/CBS domain-containing protein
MNADRALRIGTIHGIPIKVDWSFLVVFALLTWSLAAGGLPELASGYRTGEYWVAAVVTTGAFFLSLLAHEMSHSLVALRTGTGVRDITLWLLGGVSRIEDEPDNASDDLRIALVGPGASILVAIAAFATAIVTDLLGAPSLVVACIVWLGSINVLLALFNLVPAAPLDGGRVLRAILWRRRRDRTSAAISATRAGRVFAYLLVALGAAELLFGAGASGLWLVLLGWFLLNASRAEEMQIRVTRDLAGVRVRDVMTHDPVTVPAELSIDEVLHDYVLAHHCSSFPVVDRGGEVVGLVTMRQLRALPAPRRALTTAADVAMPRAEVPAASPGEPLLEVLRRTTGSEEVRILVFDAGRLAGIVSPTDVTRAVQAAELQHAD